MNAALSLLVASLCSGSAAREAPRPLNAGAPVSSEDTLPAPVLGDSAAEVWEGCCRLRNAPAAGCTGGEGRRVNAKNPNVKLDVNVALAEVSVTSLGVRVRSAASLPSDSARWTEGEGAAPRKTVTSVLCQIGPQEPT